MTTDYYTRPEVSNSDLTALKLYLEPRPVFQCDLEQTFRFGSLVDAMITEQHLVNYADRSLNDDFSYTPEDFELAGAMSRLFLKDELCRKIYDLASKQKITIVPDRPFDIDGLRFTLGCRCKWDLFVESHDMAVEIKTTKAKTEKEFRDSIDYFDYDRAAVWYLDLEKRNNMMIVGISRSLKLFFVPVVRGDQIFRRGKAKRDDIVMKYWAAFGHFDIESLKQIEVYE